MVAEPIKPPISKMPPKKGHVGQKRKAKSRNAEKRATERMPRGSTWGASSLVSVTKDAAALDRASLGRSWYLGGACSVVSANFLRHPFHT